MNRVLAILLSCVVTAAAEPKEPELPKSVVPESKLQRASIETAKLPKLLREALLAEDEFSQGTDKLPETLFVSRIDLNGDGSLEYIVESRQSYSGGTAHVVFERRKNNYESIGYFQGGFHLAARANGYYQICGTSRGGGGNFTYYVLRFARGEYRTYTEQHVNFNAQ